MAKSNRNTSPTGKVPDNDVYDLLKTLTAREDDVRVKSGIHFLESLRNQDHTVLFSMDPSKWMCYASLVRKDGVRPVLATNIDQYDPKVWGAVLGVDQMPLAALLPWVQAARDYMTACHTGKELALLLGVQSALVVVDEQSTKHTLAPGFEVTGKKYDLPKKVLSLLDIPCVFKKFDYAKAAEETWYGPEQAATDIDL